MAINENTRGLIDALSKNDYKKAKAYASCVLANDNSEKNRIWRERTEKVLKNIDLSDGIEIPANIQSMCELSRPSDFRPEQYYLPEREKDIVDEIFRRRKICMRMESLGVKASNTTLLYGDTGTGKTSLAKYIAWKLQKPLVYVRFSNMIDAYMGKTALNLSLVFDFFRANDIILLLDELDTVSRERTGGNGADAEIARITVTIMQEMDKLSGDQILIAATNRKDLIDPALLRRFSIQHHVKPFTEEDKENMIHIFWEGIGIPNPCGDGIVDISMSHKTTPAEIRGVLVKELEEVLEKTEETEPEKKKKDAVTFIPEEYKNLMSGIFAVIDNKEEMNRLLILKSDRTLQELAKDDLFVSRIYEKIRDRKNELESMDEFMNKIRLTLWLFGSAYKEMYGKNGTLEQVKVFKEEVMKE